jgi:hypothetical protein
VSMPRVLFVRIMRFAPFPALGWRGVSDIVKGEFV